MLGYCSDCILSPSIEYGVTSTSTYATSESWSEELQETISGGMSFLGFSKSKSVSETVSKSVSESMSSSFTISVSKTCATTCGSKNGTYYLYQWIMEIGEIIHTDTVPFLAYACDYVCTESQNIIPQCPLTACANQNCTVCDPWQANTTDTSKFN